MAAGPGILGQLGKLLQVVGLAVPVVAIFAQLVGVFSLGQMLMAAIGSLAAFYLGQMIEGFAK